MPLRSGIATLKKPSALTKAVVRVVLPVSSASGADRRSAVIFVLLNSRYSCGRVRLVRPAGFVNAEDASSATPMNAPPIAPARAPGEEKLQSSGGMPTLGSLLWARAAAGRPNATRHIRTRTCSDLRTIPPGEVRAL